MSLVIPISTIIVGFIIGYMGQRSGFCTISGCKNFIVARDTYVFKSIPGLFMGALATLILFSRIGGNVPEFPLFFFRAGFTPLELVLTIIGGLGLGFFSVIGGGCPFRQHVMAAEGRRSAMVYLLGLYAGLLYFYSVVAQLLAVLPTA